MRLRRIRLADVRGVDAAEVVFTPHGVTVVEAPNEAGKTTLLEAVDLLLRFKDTATARAIKELQPADRDVGSTIEVEMVLGGTHLTCTKTFNRDRQTVLRLHAPTADVLRGAVAHDRLEALFNAEVDRGLYDALRLTQGRGLDAVGLSASAVLEARLDAAAGGSGHTSDSGLLARAEAEYLRWYTRTGREGTALSDRDQAVADAEAHHTGLHARLAALEADSARLALVDQELPTLQRRRDVELPAALADAEARVAQLTELRRAVALASAELGRAEAQQDAARTHQAARTELVARVEELTDELARDEPDALVEDRAAAAEQAQVEARQAHGEAAGAVAEARRGQADAQRLVDLVTSEAEQADLADRHARVTAILAEARTAAETLAGLRLDAVGLDRIRRAEQAVRTAEATLAAGAPVLAVRAATDLTVQVDGVAHALTDGDALRQPVGEDATLDVPGVVQLTVTAGTSAAELHRTLAAARDRITAACDDAGVTDLDEAERRAAERTAAEAVLARRDSELARELGARSPAELEAELRAATQRVAALEAAGGLPAPRPEPAAARAALAAAQTLLRQAEAAEAAAREVLDAATEQASAARAGVERHVAVRTAREQALARATGQLTDARREITDEALAAALTAAEQAVTAAEQARRERQGELADLDPEAVELTLTNLTAQRSDLDTRCTELETERITLRERLRLGGEEGLGEGLAKAADDLARARADQRRDRARAAAARLLHTELTTARDEAYRAYHGPLRERIAGKARLLLGGDVDVVLDDDLAVSARVHGGVTLAWDQLSAGAREQLAILTALSAAELAGSDGVPFILDDALGYTDPARLERIGALLGRVTDAQVIVLTCVADRFRHVGGAHTVRLGAGAGTEAPTGGAAPAGPADLPGTQGRDA